MQLINAEIDRYLLEVTPRRPSILQEMEALARERNFPIVGPLVGRLCQQMVLATGAKRIFEMGSGFGYSAFWMAMVLPEEGKIICTERSQENIDLATAFFRRAGLLDKADFLRGDALDIIQEVEGQFDIIMNDVEKERYPQALDLMVPRVRKGGFIITDNMFWHGRVVEPNPGPDTMGVLQYTRRVCESKELLTTIIPLRDGVALSLKI
ncbi:MAG: O-methyltransferase [bacterium]